MSQRCGFSKLSMLMCTEKLILLVLKPEYSEYSFMWNVYHIYSVNIIGQDSTSIKSRMPYPSRGVEHANDNKSSKMCDITYVASQIDTRLIVQQLVYTNSKKNIQVPHYSLSVRGTTGDQWIPLIKSQ